MLRFVALLEPGEYEFCPSLVQEGILEHHSLLGFPKGDLLGLELLQCHGLQGILVGCLVGTLAGFVESLEL
jgi:hypothetical protein